MTVNDTARALGLTDDDREEKKETRYEQLTGVLLDANDLGRLPKLEPLVVGILDLGSVNWLQGKPGHAKSFIALDLTCHIAIGRAWWGREVRHGPVLYVAAEVPATGMRQRLRAWEVCNQTRVPAGQLKFLPMAVQLLGELDVYALGRVIAELQPVLVVIDTQARVTVGGEDSSKDMGVFVENLNRLSNINGAAVLVVHHEGTRSRQPARLVGDGGRGRHDHAGEEDLAAGRALVREAEAASRVRPDLRQSRRDRGLGGMVSLRGGTTGGRHPERARHHRDHVGPL